MPTRTPGDPPAGSVRELGLPPRAVTALTRAGITSAADLAALSRRDLAAVPGLGAGMIAAIRQVVPEPPAGSGRAGGRQPAGRAQLPYGVGDEEDSPGAAEIPSFDSLRAPRRRTAMDVLVPHSPEPEPEPEREPEPGGAPGAPGSRPGAAPPRPPEYADLLLLGAHLARGLVAVPVRLARWSLHQPVRCVRRLIGAAGPAGPGRG